METECGKRVGEQIRTCPIIRWKEGTVTSGYKDLRNQRGYCFLLQRLSFSVVVCGVFDKGLPHF